MSSSKLVFALALPLFGQGTLSVTGPATVRPGGTLALSVTDTGVPAPGAAGLQWTLAHPGLTPAWTVGAQGIAAAKDLNCRVQAVSTTCLLVGINQNIIQPGEVAKITVPVPATTTGTVLMTLSGVIAASATGSSVPVIAGPPLSVIVLRREDLSGDGKVDLQDLAIFMQQAHGYEACTTGDLDGDGACTVLDAQIIVNQAVKERTP